MSDGKNLSTKQVAAVSALLASPTKADAAKAVGISTRQLARWELLPAFVTALAEARRAMFREGVNRILRRIEKALDAVERNLDAGSPNAELRAAEILIDAAFRWRGLDVEEQLDEIGRALKEIKDAQRP